MNNRIRIELNFTGTKGLAVGREFALALMCQLDTLERWKNNEAEFAQAKSKFTEGCGVGIDVPQGVRVTIDVPAAEER